MIQYIHYPQAEYFVNFSRSSPPCPILPNNQVANLSIKDRLKRVGQAVVIPLQLVAKFTLAMLQATRATVCDIPRALYRYALGYDRIDAALINRRELRITYFFLSFPYHAFIYPPALLYSGMAWACRTWSTYLVDAFKEKLVFSPQQRLRQTPSLDSEINVDHLLSYDTRIDDSHVPQEIQVSKLLELYDRINFTRPNEAGYMNPARAIINDNDIPVSPQAARMELTTFVENVRLRRPITLSPNYEHLEKALRVIIFKLTSDITRFEQAHHPRTALTYSADEKIAYHMLLEQCGRLAIDMAMAASHCGGRYTTDVMAAYRLYIDVQSRDDNTLAEQIGACLAEKRQQIAKEEVRKYVHAHYRPGQDQAIQTHFESGCWSALGPILRLPASQGVNDSFITPSSEEIKEMMHNFGVQYTATCIIQTIQNKYRTNETFRTHTLAWIVDQIGDWAKEGKVAYTEKIDRILTIIGEGGCDISPQLRDLEILMGLIEKRRDSLPSLAEGWEPFLYELLHQDKAGTLAYFVEHFPELFEDQSDLTFLRVRHQFLARCSEPILGKAVCAQLTESLGQGIVADISSLSPLILQWQQMREVKSLLGGLRLSDQLLAECLREGNAEQIQKMLIAEWELKRKQEFLHALGLQGEELPFQVAAWLATAQGILHKPPPCCFDSDRISASEPVPMNRVSGLINRLAIDLEREGKAEVLQWLRDRYSHPQAEENRVEDEQVLEDQAKKLLEAELPVPAPYSPRMTYSQRLVQHLYRTYFAHHPSSYIKVINRTSPFFTCKRMWHATVSTVKEVLNFKYKTIPLGKIAIAIGVTAAAGPILFPLYSALVATALPIYQATLPILSTMAQLALEYPILTQGIVVTGVIIASLRTGILLSGVIRRMQGLMIKMTVSMIFGLATGTAALSAAVWCATILTPAIALFRLSYNLAGRCSRWITRYHVEHIQRIYREQGISALWRVLPSAVDQN